MIAFSYAGMALSLGSVAAMITLTRRGIWKPHRWKVLTFSVAGLVLALIGVIGVSA